MIQIQMASRCLNEMWISQLTRILGANKIKTSPAQRTQFSKDEAHFRGVLPELVLEPTSVQEVSEIVKYCNQVKCPVVAFGTGTGMEGGAISTRPGITMSLLQIEGGVTSLNLEDFDCSVRPSVTRVALNEHIRHTGLFFSVDPGADASVCGMVATGASGTNSVRYGTIKENILNLEVVLADGTIVHTRGKGRRPRKSSAGYNLTETFLGSEGTLGIITEATVRLNPRPSAQAAAVTSFENVHDAVTSVVQVLQCGIPIARIELLDEAAIAASNSYSQTDLSVSPTMFLEFHGATELEVTSQSELVSEICRNNGSVQYNSSCNEERMSQLWKARHDAFYAAMALRKGATGFSTDVCVPITKLTNVVEETKVDLQKSGITGTIVGHVGDGNFHVIIPVYHEDSKEMKAVFAFSNRLVKRALRAGGTCTGEHGIGLGKIKYLEEEIGSSGIAASRMIKKAFDPNNILNPGKVLREWS